ncbi:MAG: Rrf2 family transcriptional regulator [Chloroflexi bacterium]|nr:Rrf2 family transcriptional regulator [Chloroflexota bacterium]
MRLSTKGRYGVRALLDVALNNEAGPVLLKDIAKRQDVSAQYLEHLISPLIRAGILRSQRGSRGGISLGRTPEEISLSQVVEILEGSVAPVECVDNPEVCSRSSTCVTRDIWVEMKAATLGVLGATTLKDLMIRHKRKARPGPGTYSI